MMRFTYQMLVTEMGLSLLSHNKQLEIGKNKKKLSTYCRLTFISQYTTFLLLVNSLVPSFKYEYSIFQVLRSLEELSFDGLYI